MLRVLAGWRHLFKAARGQPGSPLYFATEFVLLY